jgi:hypothetical protein
LEKENAFLREMLAKKQFVFWGKFSYLCSTNDQSMANPNGKKGSPLHQEVQDMESVKTKAEFKNQPNVIVREETPVSTPEGAKKHRVADVAAYTVDNKGIKFYKIVQIGKTNKDGKPVKREQEAIDDIEKHTDIRVTFIDYQKYLK